MALVVLCEQCGEQIRKPSRHGGIARFCSMGCRVAWADTPEVVSARFWSKVDKSGDCWIWKASVSVNGYGKFGLRGSIAIASRVAWELTYGTIPDDMSICHHCDNPPCVRPEHLFLGTQQDNITDMVQKGRCGSYDRRGDNNPRATMTEATVIAMRDAWRNGEQVHAIAARLGLNRATAKDAIYGRSWKHLPQTSTMNPPSADS